MDISKLPEWVAKVASLWVAVGTFLIMLGGTGVNLPDFLPELFSQTFVDQALILTGAVINFMQFVRAIFTKQEIDELQRKSLQAPEGAEMFLSSYRIKKGAFLVNPFKVKIAG